MCASEGHFDQFQLAGPTHSRTAPLAIVGRGLKFSPKCMAAMDGATSQAAHSVTMVRV